MSSRPSDPGTVNSDSEPTVGPTAQDKRDLEQQLNGAREEIRQLRSLLARSGDDGYPMPSVDARVDIESNSQQVWRRQWRRWMP